MSRAVQAVLGCGVVLLVVMITISKIDARNEISSFLILIAIASTTYIVSLWLVTLCAGGARWQLTICLLLALVWRLPLLISSPLLSDDVYRYIWDGRVQRIGYNPYDSIPADPELQQIHVPLTQRIDPSNAALPTIYPPAAELFFRAVVTIDESVRAMALAILVCDILIVWVLLRWFYVTKMNLWWILGYAWNPLVAIEGAGGSHIDVLGTFFVVLTIYALAKKRTAIAGAAFAIAVAVKFLPIVLTPLLWKRIRLRDAVLGIGIGVMVYLPFVTDVSGFPFGSLAVYAEDWRFNGPLFGWLEPVFGTFGSLALATMSGLAVAAYSRRCLPQNSPAAWAWPMATTLLLMPVIYPWYLFWLTPFLIIRSTVPLLVWTLSVLLTYSVWQSELFGHGWVLPSWVMPIEYGLVVVALVCIFVFRRWSSLSSCRMFT